MKHIFILNPMAGKGDKIESLRSEINEVCTRVGVEFEIYETTARYDAEDFVRKTASESSQKMRFYACGGDGTLGEVANGAVGHINAEIATVPIGTGNDFVRNFGDVEPFLDIEKQVLGEPKAIDLIKCNNRYGINVLNVGFDCNVVVSMENLRKKKILPGKMLYGASVVTNFFKKFGTQMKLVADDLVIDREMLLCAIANGGYYGGGYHAAPRAELDDGLIDLCIIEKVSRATFASLVGPYKEGLHLEKKLAEKCVTYKKCKKLSIELENEINFCIDGEIDKLKKADIEICHKAVMFSVPKGCTSC